MQDEQVAALLEVHLARYPVMCISDVYKLLHQAVFGPGHAVPSKKVAREWLDHEMSHVEQGVPPALVESIHPDGAIVRLHLAPYVALGGVAKPLLNAMVRSAEQVSSDPALMAAWWALFARLCETSAPFTGQFPLQELALFGRFRAAEQWPAVHHSPAYVREYQPAYRVLTAREAEAVCAALGVAYEPV